ncbi:hypothetical protein BKA56DRAFT_605522 [Ilyonectria sp. MPI-CAGE-AT-0026]|nr:hypothetical protein BKA56DRAFT_605522 [Ilyonectria sp. MPI-CAGE-AT-0026]
MNSRKAVLSDLERIVNFVLETMVEDPAWPYRFKYRTEFPDDHRKYTEMIWRNFLDDDYKDWIVRIMEEVDNGKHTILAVSVWNISYKNKRKDGIEYTTKNPYDDMTKNGGATRKDADPGRIEAFRESGALCNKHFEKNYGDRRITLQILGTHPGHLRRGYATDLCNWGMNVAHEEGLVCTVQATYLGRRLYKKLGFTDLDECLIQVPGEQEMIECWAMVWIPKP